MKQLRCNVCETIVRTADDLGFGYRGKPKAGATHVCDRFQYGFLEEIEVPDEKTKEE